MNTNRHHVARRFAAIVSIVGTTLVGAAAIAAPVDQAAGQKARTLNPQPLPPLQRMNPNPRK